MALSSQPRVAIIGAGVIGAAIADGLAARGAAVTLYDMRSPGRGASQASAGVLSPFIEAKPGSPLLQLGRRSLAQWDEFVEQLCARAGGMTFGYARTGTFEVALDQSDVDRLTASAAWLASEQIASRWVDRQSLAEVEPAVTPAALGGLLIEPHGSVDVRGLVRALMHAARLSGATCTAPAEVLRIEQRRGGHVLVNHGDASVEYDRVVIAAGSWSGRVRVEGLPAFSVRPIRGQLLQLRGVAPAARRSVWGPRCYTVPWPDGTLLVGATVEDVGFNEESTADGVRSLLEAVSELLPAAAHASVDDIRVGLRPVTADHLPLLGPLPEQPRVIMAAGHYRNGILLAPLTADVVTRYILDDIVDEAFTATDPARFF